MHAGCFGSSEEAPSRPIILQRKREPGALYCQQLKCSIAALGERQSQQHASAEATPRPRSPLRRVPTPEQLLLPGSLPWTLSWQTQGTFAGAAAERVSEPAAGEPNVQDAEPATATAMASGASDTLVGDAACGAAYITSRTSSAASLGVCSPAAPPHVVPTAELGPHAAQRDRSASDTAGEGQPPHKSVEQPGRQNGDGTCASSGPCSTCLSSGACSSTKCCACSVLVGAAHDSPAGAQSCSAGQLPAHAALQAPCEAAALRMEICELRQQVWCCA